MPCSDQMDRIALVDYGSLVSGCYRLQVVHPQIQQLVRYHNPTSSLASMELSVAAPHQHNQPSRKGKKAWRKNVNVSDIQAGLENVRDEVIKG